MAKFVQLSTEILVNIDHIAVLTEFEKSPNKNGFTIFTRITFARDVGGVLEVAFNLEEVMRLLNGEDLASVSIDAGRRVDREIREREGKPPSQGAYR